MKKKRFWIWIIPGLLVFCVLSVVISGLVNLGLPKESPVVESLSSIEKARLAEAVHLRTSLGDTVFPGFGEAPIGQVVYNESYAFVINLQDPAQGWQALPSEKSYGTIWETVPDEYWEGETYYRQPLNGEVTPQAFAVRIGDSYAGSMTTFDWTRISLMDQFRRDLPSWLKPVFPYQLAVNTLIRGSDMYISLLVHETFHAYQAYWAPQRFFPAERARDLEDEYPWMDEDGIEMWKTELEILQTALRCTEPEEVKALATDFLAQRTERREAMGVSDDLIAYENHREWMEGMARYVELESWRLATNTENYLPIESLSQDPAFQNYKKYTQRWKQEVAQMTRMADDEGDGRFYYSGMAQAYLLDVLDPDWKENFLDHPELNLEDLLRMAVE